jgi:hypothetical protein
MLRSAPCAGRKGAWQEALWYTTPTQTETDWEADPVRLGQGGGVDGGVVCLGRAGPSHTGEVSAAMLSRLVWFQPGHSERLMRERRIGRR